MQTQGLAEWLVALFPFTLNCWGHQSDMSLELIQTLHLIFSPSPNTAEHLLSGEMR